MRKEKGITLISLVVTIIILIILAGVSINLLLGENGIITKSKQAKEKTEQAKLNEEIALNELYMQIEAEGGEASSGDNSNVYIEKLAEFKKAIADYIEEAGGIKPEYTAETITFGESIKGIVKEVTKDATATEDKILKDYTAYKDGEIITGTMTDNGSITKSLNAGGSYTIPAGYHNGSGKVTANSLSSQTQATATASDIMSGKTAWVNGTKVTGKGDVGKPNISFLFTAKDSVSNGTGAETYTYNMNYSLEFDISNYSSIKFENVSITGTRSKNYLYIYFDGNTTADYSITSDTTISLSGHTSIKIHATGKRSSSSGPKCSGNVSANITISK